MTNSISKIHVRGLCLSEWFSESDPFHGRWYLRPRFDRPGFTAMMKKVEAGNVEAIIVKDMGHLGGIISKLVRS